MNEEIKRILKDLTDLPVVEPGHPITKEEIAQAKDDSQRLDILFNSRNNTIPFPPIFDSVFERLSFTKRSLSSDDRRTAWSDFVRQNQAGSGWLETEGIALWYRDRDMLHHAASVYEDLHLQAHTNGEVQKDYLLEMMDVYSQLGEYERVRDLFVNVKDACQEEYVSKQFLEQARECVIQAAESIQEIGDAISFRELLAEYSEARNELENAKFEIDLLKAGVRFPEERRRAVEWLDIHHRMLMNKLASEAKDLLTEAVMYARSSSLQRESPVSVPIYCQKAVEIEFEVKVWCHVKAKFGKLLPSRMAGEQSINQIYEILTGSGRDEVKKANMTAYPFIEAALGGQSVFGFSRAHCQKLLKFKIHSTDARHGKIGRKYTSERLVEFLGEIGIGKPDGWIFEFLDQLQSKV